MKWHCLHPGARLLPEPEAARRWAGAVGIDFHEVRIETEAHDLTLIFSDLRVSEAPVGYAAFVTEQRTYARTQRRPPAVDGGGGLRSAR